MAAAIIRDVCRALYVLDFGEARAAYFDGEV